MCVKAALQEILVLWSVAKVEWEGGTHCWSETEEGYKDATFWREKKEKKYMYKKRKGKERKKEENI